MTHESPFEGVRPRQALCPRCGYVPGGSAIHAGKLKCPECGWAIRFELEKPVQSPRVRTAVRAISFFGAAVILAIGLVIWSVAGGRSALRFWELTLLFFVVAWIIRVSVVRRN